LAQKPTNSFKRKNQGGSRYAALAFVVLILLAIGGYLLVRFGGQQPVAPAPPKTVPAEQQVKKRPQPVPVPVQPRISSAATSRPPPTVAPKKYPEVTAPQLPAPLAPLGTSGSKAARLAILIDDMGSSMTEARSLASIGVPLTFSIIPGLRSYHEVAAFASNKGLETMLHIPMQSKGWPERRLEANGLLVAMPESELQSRMEKFMADIPTAVGANNHMGSEFTEHDDKMRAVITALKGEGLFFVDSVTSPQTSGMRVAQQLGVKTARRSVFLDNEQNEAYITGQINQAVRLARKQGSVIAICHPHPATIATLAKVLPALKSQGIVLVSVSQLVH